MRRLPTRPFQFISDITERRGLKNLAFNQPAEQVDDYADAIASKAVDGNKDGKFAYVLYMFCVRSLYFYSNVHGEHGSICKL